MARNLGDFGTQLKPLVLIRGQDFAEIIESAVGEPFPAGTSARIDIYAKATDAADESKDPLMTWDAAVTPATAVWREQSETTDTVPSTAVYYQYVTLPESPNPLDVCPFMGRVTRQLPR